ncbi:uncharacterized protein LOC129591472 [Paramacrobiotus metropolitanus]|uniref:uncharacterized protein LOC129591472 n=1 Tax=Paramacrobiotus metropolitanus TaxID=2943436 RepID=UPI0024459EB2|nr:uncharacterized protein LOC129591472 [Paramacrobiotus metropolitanus]
MDNNDQLSPFHTLPVEIVSRITAYLDVIDLIKFSTVCKRWERIVAREQHRATVIVDLRNWIKFGCNGPNHKKAQLVLKRFVTRSTRQLIVRWPFDSSPPEADFATVIPDESDLYLNYDTDGMAQYTYSYHYRGPCPDSIDGITTTLYQIHRGADNSNKSAELSHLTLILQNLKLYANGLWCSYFMQAFRFQNVQLNCHLSPFSYACMEKPIVLRIHVVDDAIRPHDIWSHERDEVPLKPGVVWPQDRIRQFGCSAHLELFGSLIRDPLSSQECRIMDSLLRSDIPFQSDHCWHKHWNVDSRTPSLAATGITMDQVNKYPRWQQYLLRDLLQNYPYKSSENGPAITRTESAVTRVYEPFVFEYEQPRGSVPAVTRGRGSTVEPPLW